MSILDRYIIKQVLTATIFVGVVLSALVLLTQSLKFLDLVINAGASGLSFWILTLLALPRFLEIVIPIGLMAGVLFVYNRLLLDSELIVMKGLGFSPLSLARPTIILSFVLCVFLMVWMAWIVPLSNADMQKKRDRLQADISNYLFREGIFNQAGKRLMVYVRDRDADGNLHGLIVYDARDKTKTPYTIIAAKGILVDADKGQQVIVYNGSRQEFDDQKQILRRLNFDQYVIDLPEDSTPIALKWKDPDERTSFELLHPDLNNPTDFKKRDAFILELHKRLSTPLLVLSFPMIGLYFLLTGALDRRGASRRIMSAVAVMVLVQILYMVTYNFSKAHAFVIPFMYVVALAPALITFSLLFAPSARPYNPTQIQNKVDTHG